MAYKMKGFPLRSGFKHTLTADGHGHVDAEASAGAEETKESPGTEIPTNAFGTNHSQRELDKAISETTSYYGDVGGDMSQGKFDSLVNRFLASHQSHDAKRVEGDPSKLSELYPG